MLKKILRRITPRSIYERLSSIKKEVKMMININTARKCHKRALSELQNKKRIRCVFFAVYEEVWKYDKVYQLMDKIERFEPIIVVCPVVHYGKENMIQRMNQCYSFFKKKNYNVICSYNDKDNSFIDVKKEINPDIIFYTIPYSGQIDERYCISSFPHTLSVYVPYFIDSNLDYEMASNLPLHNLVWRKYSETSYHKRLYSEHSLNHGRNVVTTGYPGVECYLANNVTPSRTKKLIIWAPHHTIEPVGIIYYSCFLKYCNVMIELVRKYSNQAEFVFKPHPLLKNKLYKKWGREKTDSYYNMWNSMDNTSLNEGSYERLFIESDAMIHDSASFIVEYLYLNKPVMRTMNGEDINKMYNPFGIQCIDNHYKGYKEDDIENFIQNVINGVDPLREHRTKFVNDVLMPKGSPSQNIIDDILDSIDNQILYRN